MNNRLVVIESPYAGEVERNVKYARRCLLDSLERGEAPFAGHLLYTQVLDDTDPEQRAKGIAAHCSWIKWCPQVIVYVDYGISAGMQQAIDLADRWGTPITRRFIGKNK